MDYKKVKLGDSNSIPQSMWSTDDNILCEDGKTLRENLKNILIGASGIEWLDIEGDEIFQALVPCTGITLSSSSLSFTTNTTQTLTANVQPVDTFDKVIWSVSPIGIASVNNGEVTPLSNGDCIITATCGNYSATCNVNVSLPVIVECTGITLSSNALTFTTSDAQTLTATVEPSDCTQPVVWSVEPSGVANITNNIVTPLINGDCTITATCGTQLATCSVNISCFEVIYTITNNLTNVTSNNSATSIAEGATYTATLTANENYAISTVTVTMGGIDITDTAYADGVITINSVTGNIVITATANSTIASSAVKVKAETIDNQDYLVIEDWDGVRRIDGKCILNANNYSNDTHQLYTVQPNFNTLWNKAATIPLIAMTNFISKTTTSSAASCLTDPQEGDVYIYINNAIMIRLPKDLGSYDSIDSYMKAKYGGIKFALNTCNVKEIDPTKITSINVKENSENSQYAQFKYSDSPTSNIYSGANSLSVNTSGNINLSAATAPACAMSTATLSIKFLPGTFTDFTLDAVKTYLTENPLIFWYN